mmetsp:Transcript_18233/g.34522  ORF Transcript_18233/g.34522 Transcript_18233/m.34522 type:complete len:139 (-) Transcript_18233:200-616(-)
MLGSSVLNKKNDDYTPDEHIPLVRLDEGGFLSGSISHGRGDRLHQMETMAKRKDAVLDDMEAAVDRLGFIAHTIRSEVTEHEQMLDGLNEEIDTADQRMGATMKKVTKLLGTSDRGRLCCILWLVLINVLLLIIIILF